MHFPDLSLSDALCRALTDLGFTEPTPIQEKAIPTLLKGQDVLGIAQTGTGKTAAFSLPILQTLIDERAVGEANPSRKQKRRQRTAHQAPVLVLAPTRELAAQIENAIAAYAKYLDVRTVLLVGGVGFGKQTALLDAGVDVVVATPGRLIDLARDGHFDFSAVRFLVLDEADRMLDMGFINDIKYITRHCPQEKQSMLFSATLSEDIRALTAGLLQTPATIELAANRDVSLISQTIYWIKKEDKRDFLRDLIVDNQWQQVLIFTQMKAWAARLCKHLIKDGFTADCIHGDRTQSARSKALAAFKEGKVQILVATDVVARGIDIKELPHVVNFDLPKNAEDYVHRIGRTGRAGSQGEAVSLMTSDEIPRLRAIERLIRKKLQVVEVGDVKADWEAQKKLGAAQDSTPCRSVNPPRRERGPRQTDERALRSNRQKSAYSEAHGRPGKRHDKPRKDKATLSHRNPSTQGKDKRERSMRSKGEIKFDYILS